MSKLNKLEVTGSDIGRVLGISPQGVSGLTTQGILHRTPNSKYLLVETTRRYITWIKDEKRHASKGATAQRVQAARAEEIEQRTAERGRQLIPMDVVKAMIIEIIGGLRADIDGIPAGITRDLVLRKKIEKTLSDILTRAADRVEQWAVNG